MSITMEEDISDSSVIQANSVDEERVPERRSPSPYHSPRPQSPSPYHSPRHSISTIVPVGPTGQDVALLTPPVSSEFVPPSQLVQPLRCPNCHETFATKFLLNSHPCGSPGGTSHKCGLCSKTFTRRYNLKIHVQKHFGQFPHRCNVCGTGFTKRDALRKHQSKHQVKFVSKQRPQCDICHQFFTRKYTMRLHRAKHMENGQWKCPFCSGLFGDIIKFRVHLQTHGISSKNRDRDRHSAQEKQNNSAAPVIPRNLIFSDAGDRNQEENSVLSQSDSETDMFESRSSKVAAPPRQDDEDVLPQSISTNELTNGEFVNGDRTDNPPLDFSRPRGNEHEYQNGHSRRSRHDENDNIPESSENNSSDPKIITIYKQEAVEIDEHDLINQDTDQECDRSSSFHSRPDTSRHKKEPSISHRRMIDSASLENCPSSSGGMMNRPPDFHHLPANHIRHISPSIIPRRYHVPGMMGMQMPSMLPSFPVVVSGSQHSLSPISAHNRRRNYGDANLFSPPTSFAAQRNLMNYPPSQEGERVHRISSHGPTPNNHHPSSSLQNNASSSGHTVSISPNEGRPESAISNMSAQSSGEVGQSSWRCGNCRISFEDSLMYVVHMGCHSHDNPYACNMCGYVCSDRLAFMLHFVKGQHS